MLRLGVVAEQPPSRSRSVNPSPRNPATPGRWVLPICSGTAALDGSSSSGVGSVPFLTITSHSHSPVNAVKNTTNDCAHPNLDQLRTTLPARAHVCSYRFSTRWVEVLTRRVNEKKRQKRSCKSVTVKGEVWGGLIPGLPYTAVDYVIIMKNVRHKEEFQIEAKCGKVPKRAVKCSRRAS